MNLALHDVRHNLGRFALTTIGIGLLLMIVLGMSGIYRGLIAEATLLVDRGSLTPFGARRTHSTGAGHLSSGWTHRRLGRFGGRRPGIFYVERRVGHSI